ncbi:MAG: VWA domain-containing protein [Bacteroidales bacterium]|nr:VWA domain-containing protein [Bacteroidales bacterium]
MKLKILLPVFLLIIATGTQSFTIKKQKAKIQIALLLDTSNSMDGLINQAKSQLWKIVNEMAKSEVNGETPTLEIALYEYGNDQLSMREGYIRQVTTFTTDLDKISEKLFALKTDGGSEFCGQVIDVSLKQLAWSESDTDLKMIFIAGNEPFNQGEVDYRKSCQKAVNKDITVNTIFCGDYKEGIRTFWKDGADLANGKYMNIDSDKKEVYIASPYDKKLTQLNKQLNDTYIGYGSAGKKMKARQEMQDKNAMSMGQQAYLNRAVSKSSKMYSNSSWDLVDAYKNNPDIVNDLTDKQLPEELQGKSKSEIKTLLDKKLKERTAIQEQINILNVKRDKYVTKKRKEMATDNNKALDDAMIEAVKEQAVQKNFKFK